MKPLLSLLILILSINLFGQKQCNVYMHEKNKPAILLGKKVQFSNEPVEKTYTLIYNDNDKKEIIVKFEYAGKLKDGGVSYYKALNKYWLINRIGSGKYIEFSIVGIKENENGKHTRTNESIEFSN
jgi:hypothetical protein